MASSLMTPADARSNTNLHKVRMFSADKLSKSNREEKWDRAKVICTQPFNKSQQYGLSFISFLTDEESKGADTNPLQTSFCMVHVNLLSFFVLTYHLN